MNNTGVLYGIGVGPGDPELITLKAVRILNAVDVVFAASSTKNDYSLALATVKDHLKPDVEIRSLAFPMTKEQALLEEAWQANAETVEDVLRRGKNAAFITIGDALTYSTFGYLMRALFQRAPDIKVTTVPGITAYNAAAARINTPLAEGKESLTIVSGVDDPEQMRRLLDSSKNAVILKTYKDYDRICDTLEELELDDGAVLVSRCGHDDERIEKNPGRLRGEKMPYLSLMIVKKNGDV